MSRTYSDNQIKFIVKKRAEEMDWESLAEVYNKKFKENRTKKALRHAYERYGDVDLSEGVAIKNIISNRRVTKSKTTIAKENRLILDYLQECEDQQEALLEICKKSPINLHKKVPASKKEQFERTLVAHVSDTHIGLIVDAEEVGHINKFNPLIASRRFAYFFKEIANYKPQHRKDTELVVVLNGDILEGVIHNQEWGVLPMTTQFAVAQRILAEGISYLANHFKKVTVHTTMGNHSRFLHKNNKGRQTHMKWDGFGTMLYLAIRDTLEKTHKNVSFNIPKTPYAFFKIQGHNVFATHGDNCVNVGNVSSKIDVGNISNQLNNISVGLGERVDIAMLGHVHQNLFQSLDNNTELCINSTLSGSTSFGVSLGYLTSNPAQQIFEVTKKHAVGDMRFIKLKEADEDASLDKIITPVKGWYE